MYCEAQKHVEATEKFGMNDSHIHTYIHTNTYTHTHKYIHTYIHTYIHRLSVLQQGSYDSNTCMHWLTGSVSSILYLVTEMIELILRKKGFADLSMMDGSKRFLNGSLRATVCMYVCMYGCMYVCMYIRMYVCMYVCMYLCMYVCMYEFIFM